MPYSPPAWNAVTLPFASGYTPPDWNEVLLAFGAPASATAQTQTADGIAQVITPAPLSTSQAQTADAVATVIERRPLLYAQATMPWRGGLVRDLQLRLPWIVAPTRDREQALAWDAGSPQDVQTRLAWANSLPQDREIRVPISPGDPVQIQPRLAWSSARPADRERWLPWRHARLPIGVQRALPWVAARPRDQARRAPWGKASAVDHQVWLATGRAKPRDLQRTLPWGMGTAPRHQWLPEPPYVPPGGPPLVPCYTPPEWGAVRLRFGGPSPYAAPAWNAVPLAFVCENRYFRITRSLRLSHSLSVVRLPDRLPLRVTAVSISTDRDSWAWSFSLRFADRASLLAVAPSPSGVVSVEISLDGYVWTALIESYQEDRQLARKQASATGRSRTAVLAAPYDPERAYTNPAPATAEQLALRELDFTGFGLDWQLDAWTVPAGAWAYDRATHIGAITTIAAAAGGIVQSDTGSDTVIVLPRYPVMPWEIAAAAPVMTIEAGSCINLGKRYQAGAGYQGVYVSGRDQGVRVNVYRDGTGGSPYAPLVVDPLITETAAAVARGQSVIAAATTREEISLLLPMTPAPAAPGLLTPGKVVDVEDATWGTYKAVTVGCAIDAEVAGDGVVTARQAVTVERYLLP